MITIDPKNRPILLEALEDLMYKISLELSGLKGGPMDKNRKALTEKQQMIEDLQHAISKS